MIGGRTQAAVMPSLHWMLASLLLWEGAEAARRSLEVGLGDWPIGLFDLVSLSVVPLIVAVAYIRLFTAVVQSGYGSMNAYAIVSSPWAWLFWTGLVLTLTAYGLHLGAHMLDQSVPEVVRHGEFGSFSRFLDGSLAPWLMGIGLILVNAIILVLGQGSTQRAIPGERLLLVAGSVLTFGAGILYVGIEGRLHVPAIIGAGLLTAVGLRHLSLWEVEHDPVSLAIVPGAAGAGAILLVWSLLVGGQPTWPW